METYNYLILHSEYYNLINNLSPNFTENAYVRHKNNMIQLIYFQSLFSVSVIQFEPFSRFDKIEKKFLSSRYYIKGFLSKRFCEKLQKTIACFILLSKKKKSLQTRKNYCIE